VPSHVFPVIVLVGIAGILLNDPTVFYHLHPTASQWLVWFGANFLLLLVLAGAGVRLGPRVGLGASEAGDARLAWRRLRDGLPAAGGLAAVSIVWFLAVATALHHLDFIQSELAEPMWVAQLGGVGAGLSEEIGYRLGIMTVLVWAIARIWRRARPTPAVVWSAIGLSALLFGLLHLGQAGAGAAGTAAGAATVILTTGGTGVAFGWVYWRRGLLVAIVAHMIVDCLGAALAPVLVPLVHHLG
jgi:membrane protease YdiL (CAAX protease family)